MMKLVTKDLESYQFIAKLKDLSFIDEIWLFGSRGRGDQHDRSDIDLAIICPKATSRDWQKVLGVIDEADTLLKIDCLRFDTLSKDDTLRFNILRDKRLIYQKDKSMENFYWKDSFITLGKAIQRLTDVLEHPDINRIDYMRDASIQRFEFVTELFWKVLKKILAYEKIDTTTPRDVIKNAYQYQLIHHEEVWLDILTDRNNTSHVYKEEDAKRIFDHIKGYRVVFEETYRSLQTKYNLF